MKTYISFKQIAIVVAVFTSIASNTVHSQKSNNSTSKKRQYPNYIPFYHGMSFESGYHSGFYAELGYSALFTQYYYKNKKYLIRSKEVLFVVDQKIGYHALNALSLKSSFRCSFETRNWEFHPSKCNIGLDYTYLNDFKGGQGNIFTPKIGFTLFFGCLELNYGYNFIPNNNKTFDFKDHSVGLVFRPYIFLKPMKNMWG